MGLPLLVASKLDLPPGPEDDVARMTRPVHQCLEAVASACPRGDPWIHARWRLRAAHPRFPTNHNKLNGWLGHFHVSVLQTILHLSRLILLFFSSKKWVLGAESSRISRLFSFTVDRAHLTFLLWPILLMERAFFQHISTSPPTTAAVVMGAPVEAAWLMSSLTTPSLEAPAATSRAGKVWGSC